MVALLTQKVRIFFHLDHNPQQIIPGGIGVRPHAPAVCGCLDAHFHIIRLIDEQILYPDIFFQILQFFGDTTNQNGKYSLGYDVMVRDSPECPEWSCYESLQEEVRYNAWNLEREMFLVLDRAVTRLGLSYTEYVFPKLYGASS